MLLSMIHHAISIARFLVFESEQEARDWYTALIDQGLWYVIE